MKNAEDLLAPEDKTAVYAYLRRRMDLHPALYDKPLIYLVIVSLMMQAIRDIDNPYKGSVKPKY